MFSNVLLSHSLSLDMLNNFCFHLYAQKSLSHSHTLISLSHLTLSLTLDMLNNFCFHVYAEKSLSHYHTLSLSHSLTLTLSHSFSLSFSHSRHAEQLLFSCLCSKVTVYSWKWQCFFFDHHSHSSITLSCYIRVHRAGSQLKMAILLLVNSKWPEWP